ncbi:TetR/AcrR family transcriptional regulator C-terminal ligand-binding domain-containing protein [Nocardioides carbamazepini]|uniref:TetR-like C-terminal domain-containing protein n=1 Tax=Nocardioides carbamazepini TaxID=2854259 RepID=UPI00214A5178|nr:TetR-like C-terminal domain-containing protein [Nocardioides carbamazepini]MCR1786666.1 TetR/AcrR family transcriptional regulator C-terminal ligand-binding domain-containing protein [Nocardioides carbamazepini]
MTAEQADQVADPLTLKILEAVVALMRDGGISAVTTGSVAAAASVSKATIYRRWPSMSKLVAEAAAHAFPEVTVPDLGDVVAELRWFLTERIRQYAEPGSARLVASLIGASVSDDHVQAFFRSWVAAQSQSSRAVFERAVARGEFPADLDIDDLRTVMSAPVMFRAVAEDGVPDEALVETVLAMVRAVRASA